MSPHSQAGEDTATAPSRQVMRSLETVPEAGVQPTGSAGSAGSAGGDVTVSAQPASLYPEFENVSASLSWACWSNETVIKTGFRVSRW
eukprot:910196-Rhodomonas_salina.2